MLTVPWHVERKIPALAQRWAPDHVSAPGTQLDVERSRRAAGYTLEIHEGLSAAIVVETAHPRRITFARIGQQTLSVFGLGI